MKKNIRKQQDIKRRENLAYAELAEASGHLQHVYKLINLQYLVGSLFEYIGEDIDLTLEHANLTSNKTISIQNALRKSTASYFEYFKHALKDDAAEQWSEDLDNIIQVVYNHANIDEFEPELHELKEVIAELEQKYDVTLRLPE